MRSTKAFLIGAGTALFLGRAWGRRRRRASIPAAVDDATISRRIRNVALPAVGVSTREIDVEVHDGIVELRGSVEGSERADALLNNVAKMPGVRDVAAVIRVSDRRAA